MSFGGKRAASPVFGDLEDQLIVGIGGSSNLEEDDRSFFSGLQDVKDEEEDQGPLVDLDEFLEGLEETEGDLEGTAGNLEGVAQEAENVEPEPRSVEEAVVEEDEDLQVKLQKAYEIISQLRAQLKKVTEEKEDVVKENKRLKKFEEMANPTVRLSPIKKTPSTEEATPGPSRLSAKRRRLISSKNGTTVGSADSKVASGSSAQKNRVQVEASTVPLSAAAFPSLSSSSRSSTRKTRKTRKTRTRKSTIKCSTCLSQFSTRIEHANHRKTSHLSGTRVGRKPGKKNLGANLTTESAGSLGSPGSGGVERMRLRSMNTNPFQKDCSSLKVVKRPVKRA